MENAEKMTLSVPEAAKILGISTPTMYQLIKTDDFPIVHIGKRILVSAKGLGIWLDAHTGGGEKYARKNNLDNKRNR